MYKKVGFLMEELVYDRILMATCDDNEAHQNFGLLKASSPTPILLPPPPSHWAESEDLVIRVLFK